MKVYVYQCPACGKLLERQVRAQEIKSFCEKTGKDVICKRKYTPIPFRMSKPRV